MAGPLTALTAPTALTALTPMDPLTHTLFGATLAASGLGKRSPLATAALVLGANAPDVDIVSYFAGRDAALAHRRGLTHGLLAMVVLPLVLVAVLWLYDRLWRRRDPGAAPLQVGWIVALAYLAVWSHPCLDWLNTYGVRWLMPFDGRWFYGDAVFIVDPWLWLLLATPLFLLYSQTRPATVAWGVLALTTSVPVLAVTGPWPWARVLWLGALLVLFTLRWRDLAPRTPAARRRLATVLLGCALVYILGMVGTARWARQEVLAEAAAHGVGPVEDLMVGPLPIDPLARDVVLATPESYHYGQFQYFAPERLNLDPEPLPKPPPSPVVSAALKHPSVQGMVGWARFPFVELEEVGARIVVFILDARYTKTRTQGFGGATVVLEPDAEPVDARAPAGVP